MISFSLSYKSYFESIIKTDFNFDVFYKENIIWDLTLSNLASSS